MFRHSSPKPTIENLQAERDNLIAVIKGQRQRIDEQDDLLRLGASDKTFNLFLFFAGLIMGALLAYAAHYQGVW